MPPLTEPYVPETALRRPPLIEPYCPVTVLKEPPLIEALPPRERPGPAGEVPHVRVRQPRNVGLLDKHTEALGIVAHWRERRKQPVEHRSHEAQLLCVAVEALEEVG